MNQMNWKRAAMYGAFGAAAVLFLKGHRPASLAVAGVGLGFLAIEHPEKFEEVFERAPEYLERGSQIVAVIARIKERLEQEGVRAIPGAWQQATSEY
jgi:hypothetical protein